MTYLFRWQIFTYFKQLCPDIANSSVLITTIYQSVSNEKK